MQVKKKLSGTLYVPILIFIVTLITGCNNDVFIDRPEISVSAKNIKVGESTTITTNVELTSQPYMSIYYNYGKNDEIMLFNGSAHNYSDEFLAIDVNINAEDNSLTMSVNKNYYPNDLKVIFYTEGESGFNVSINIVSTTPANFKPGKIEYTLDSWYAEIETFTQTERNVTYINNSGSSSSVPIISAGETFKQVGRFRPDNPIYAIFLVEDSYQVDVRAFDNRQWPIMTNQTATYNFRTENQTFTIDAYPLEVSTSTIVDVKSGSTLKYKVDVDVEVCAIRYKLPIYNDKGVHFDLTGELRISVPKKYKIQYNITD